MPPFDSVVSIGGQSFLDGIWRLLEPALQGITNPLPLAIPGFANAQMRVRQLVPTFSDPESASVGLKLRADVEVTGEALLQVLVASGAVSISIGSPTFSLTELAGPIALPARTGSLSNIEIGGTVGALPSALSGGKGTITLPKDTATLSGGTCTGTITIPDGMTVPTIPLPAVVPVALDLTSGAPLQLAATLELVVNGPDETGSGLRFVVENVTATVVGSGITARAVTSTLQKAIDQIVAQLAIPAEIDRPVVNRDAVAILIAGIPNNVIGTLSSALTGLLAETGRLIYPAAAGGASCDVRVLPTSGEAALVVASDGSYVLQAGFERDGGGDITAFPAVTDPIECQVLIGNGLVLGLLCCLVERLPAFCLPTGAVASATDVAGMDHVRCCNFTRVTANFGGVAIGGGGISVCIDGESGYTKTFALVGRFEQTASLRIPLLFGVRVPLGSIDISVRFKLPLAFDLDDGAAIANLHFLGRLFVAADVRPDMTGAVILTAVLSVMTASVLLLTGVLAPLGVMLAATTTSVIVILLLLLVHGTCAVARLLLRNAARTLLSGASLLRSPVALPPGLFEAFGKFAPVSVTVDDLEANGVLHTPTSVWGLVPRIGIGRINELVDQGTGELTTLPHLHIPRSKSAQPGVVLPGAHIGTPPLDAPLRSLEAQPGLATDPRD